MVATFLRLVFALALSVATFGPGGRVAADEPLTPAEKEAVERIIHDYLLEHPEVIYQALEKLQQRQQEEAAARRQTAVAELAEEIRTDTGLLVAGNPKASVTIVEFFDYRCPYCKVMAPRLAALLDSDTDVRIVLKEYPILGPDSVYAARAALAAAEQGKYLGLHDRLMNHKGQLGKDTVLAAAREIGLDTVRLERDMQAPRVEQILRDNYDMAGRLAIDGTPAFIVGDEIVGGAMELEELQAKVKAARGS